MKRGRDGKIVKKVDGEARRDERWTNKKVRMGIGIRGLEGCWKGKGRGEGRWGCQWSRGKTTRAEVVIGF